MKKIFVIIIVCFSFLICGCSYEYKFGDFEFVGDRLTNYTGTDTEVIIPHAYVNGSKIIEVKYIDKKAFTGNSIIKSVLLPETLEKLEKEEQKYVRIIEEKLFQQELKQLHEAKEKIKIKNKKSK